MAFDWPIAMLVMVVFSATSSGAGPTAAPTSRPQQNNHALAWVVGSVVACVGVFLIYCWCKQRPHQLTVVPPLTAATTARSAEEAARRESHVATVMDAAFLPSPEPADTPARKARVTTLPERTYVQVAHGSDGAQAPPPPQAWHGMPPV
jgi:hypothetical protein